MRRTRSAPVRRTRRVAAAGVVGTLVAACCLGGVLAAPAVAAPAYPSAVTGVTARPGAGSTIVVHATGGGGAARIGVIAGANSSTSSFHFHTRWYPGTQRTFTVTVPTALQPELGQGSGNPIYVEVVQSSSSDPHAAMPLANDVAAGYRVSPSGAHALAGAVTPTTTAVSRITVAEMNIQTLVATASSAHNSWRARAPRVARTVLAAHPDLLLTAELGTTRIDPSCTSHPTKGYYCTTQRDDLAKRLAASGYADAFPDADQRVYDFGVAHPSLAGDVTFGTQILFDPRTLELGRRGTISPELTLKVSPWPSYFRDRWISWAEFTVKSSGRRFVAVAAHFASGHTADATTARAREAAALVPVLDAKAGHLPIVLAGDFNADPILDSNPDERILIRHGYFDAATTTHRTGDRYNSFQGDNGSDGADVGYPVTVHAHLHVAPRIDCILLKRSPYTYRYANVLHLAAGSSTRLDPAYEGSDHLMQVATVGIGDPA